MWLAEGGVSVLVCSDCYNHIPQTGWLKQEPYFSQFWRLRDSRSRWQQIQLRTLFLGWCLLARSSHGGEKEYLVSKGNFYEVFSWGLILMTSSVPNYFPKSPPPNVITVGIKASIYGFWRDTNTKFVTETVRYAGAGTTRAGSAWVISSINIWWDCRVAMGYDVICSTWNILVCTVWFYLTLVEFHVLRVPPLLKKGHLKVSPPPSYQRLEFFHSFRLKVGVWVKPHSWLNCATKTNL